MIFGNARRAIIVSFRASDNIISDYEIMRIISAQAILGPFEFEQRVDARPDGA